MANATFRTIKAQLSDGKCFGKTDMTPPRVSLPKKGTDPTSKIDRLYAADTIKNGKGRQ